MRSHWGAVGVAVAVFVATRPARADEVEDVTVRGDKSPPGSMASDSLSATEARQLPGAFGDPFRAIEAMPGVTPIISGLPYYYVRGAPSGNVGYYFDGVRVPYLFHFGLGPAVIQPGLIARTDLHKGGYPAEFGRYAGGVVEATAMPPADHMHGDAQVRLFDAGGLAEATFADGRGTALVGGRYSYTAALFSLLQSDTTLAYRDYQARVTYALTNRDTVSILGFGAYDLAKQRETVDPTTVSAFVDPNAAGALPTSVDRTLFASEFHRADARWDHVFSGGGTLRVAATVGFDRTQIEARRAAEDLMYATRASFVQVIAKGIVVRAGADATFDHYSGASLAKYADDDDVVARQAVLFETRTDYVAGGYVDTIITAIPYVELVPGIRFDEYGSNGRHADAVDPPSRRNSSSASTGGSFTPTASRARRRRRRSRCPGSRSPTWKAGSRRRCRRARRSKATCRSTSKRRSARFTTRSTISTTRSGPRRSRSPTSNAATRSPARAAAPRTASKSV